MDAGVKQAVGPPNGASATPWCHHPGYPAILPAKFHAYWRTPFQEYAEATIEDPAVVKAACEVESLLRDLSIGSDGSLTLRLMRCLRLTMFIEDLYVAYLLSVLGCRLNGLDRQSEAEAVHRRAMCIGARVLGTDHAELANSMQWLAFSLYRQGNFKEAVLLCYSTTLLLQSSVGHWHPDMANCLLNLATVLEGMGLSYHAADLHWKGQMVLQRLYGSFSSISVDNLPSAVDSLGYQSLLDIGNNGFYDLGSKDAYCDPYWLLGSDSFCGKAHDSQNLDSFVVPSCWYEGGDDVYCGSRASEESCSTVEVQFGSHCPEDILEDEGEGGISFWPVTSSVT